jgi:hypothetical protein
MAAKSHYREDIGNAELIRNIFARKSTTFEGVTVWAPDGWRTFDLRWWERR